MKLVDSINNLFVERVYVGEEELLKFIGARSEIVSAQYVLDEMIAAGYVSTITVRDRNIYALGTERIDIRRHGHNPCTMGF